MKQLIQTISLAALACGVSLSAMALTSANMEIFNDTAATLYVSGMKSSSDPAKAVAIAPYQRINAAAESSNGTANFKIVTANTDKAWAGDTLCAGNTTFPIHSGAFVVSSGATLAVTVSGTASNYACSAGATKIAEAYAFSQDIAEYDDRYPDVSNPRRVKTILFDAGYLDYIGAPYWHTLTSGPYKGKPNLVNTSFAVVKRGQLTPTPLTLELENLAMSGAKISLTYEMSNTVKAAVPNYSAQQMHYLVHQVVDPIVAFNQQHGSIISGISFDLESGDNSPGQSQFYRLLAAYAASKGLSISDFGFAAQFTFTQDVALGPLRVVLPSMYDVGVSRYVKNDSQFQDTLAPKDTAALQTYITRSYKPGAAQDINCESYKVQDEHHLHPAPSNYCNINLADTTTGISTYFALSRETFNPEFKLSFLDAVKQSGLWFKPVMPFSSTAQNWSYLDVYANAAEKSGTTDGDAYLGTFKNSGVMLHCVPGEDGCPANMNMEQLLQQAF